MNNDTIFKGQFNVIFFPSSKDEIKQQQELTALMTNATEHKGTDVTTFSVSLLRRCSLSLLIWTFKKSVFEKRNSKANL